jgi:hypothetical protein
MMIGCGLVATNANAPTLPNAGKIDCQPPPPVGPCSAGGAASRTGSDGTGGGRRRTGRSIGIFVTGWCEFYRRRRHDPATFGPSATLVRVECTGDCRHPRRP